MLLDLANESSVAISKVKAFVAWIPCSDGGTADACSNSVRRLPIESLFPK